MALIKQSEWAHRQGFSKQYANTLIKTGQIPLVDGLVDEEQANAILASIRNPNQPIRRSQFTENKIQYGDDLPTLLLKTRIKNEIERGKLLEAKVKSEIGELVSAEAVKNAMFAKGRIIRDGIMNIPDRVSSLLATINDASKIHEILSNEIREVLTELSRDD
ncbi:hypothetical protein FACS189472_03920 [Alphaproteobacteria bacterium]|nr:hypothetical protein FACS189472_03920 [Alphaproteobacteria bacterium]